MTAFCDLGLVSWKGQTYLQQKSPRTERMRLMEAGLTLTVSKTPVACMIAPAEVLPHARTVTSVAALDGTLHSPAMMSPVVQSRSDASEPLQSSPDRPGGISETRTCKLL